MSENLKDTVLLPKTKFSMQGNLLEKDKNMIEFWRNINVFEKKRKLFENKEIFSLHMGPPYSNGHLHLGHLMNLILKDFVIRSQFCLGKNVKAKLGWDCHGLPIELKVEAEMKNLGKEIDSILEVRERCLEFAKKWLEIQKSEIESLGVFADYKNYYTTLQKEAQLSITKALIDLNMSGHIYRQRKPVMWSTVEQTTLSDAEINYKNHVSQSIFFASRITKMPNFPEITNLFLAVWTTTPWTLPGNLAYAYNKDIEYCVVQFGIFKCIVAKECVERLKDKLEFFQGVSISEVKILQTFKGSLFEGGFCEQPVYRFEVPLLHGDHVNIEMGTGIVHTAPAHGLEDYIMCKKYNIDPVDYVDDFGFYTQETPEIAGLNIFKDQQKVIALLGDLLLSQEDYSHDYPYSERGKNPIIFKLSYQWFIDIDNSGIREQCLKTIPGVRWIPAEGEKRLSSMITTRPDWCISRQRLWGVPIPLFFHKKTGKILKDEEVNRRIEEKIKEEGYSFWYIDAFQVLPEHLQGEYEFSYNIVDVWFESGMTHDYVLGHEQANLYLEGSDQHRGWFQSSIMTSVFFNGLPPYKEVLTHGFLLDQKGYKMSKSLGNVISLDDCKERYGNDILRIWVANADYTKDIRIGYEILDKQVDVYRKIRNTIRFILGITSSSNEKEKKNIYNLNYDKIDFLDKWILAKIYELNENISSALSKHEFKNTFLLIFDFCVKDLSAMYLDICKDTLYCDHINNERRQAVVKILCIVRDFLLFYLRIFIPTTAEDAFLSMIEESETYWNKYESIFLVDDFEVSEVWKNEEILLKVQKAREYNENILRIIEEERQKGNVTSNMSVKLTIKNDDFLSDNNNIELIKTILMVEEISVVSNMENSLLVEKTTKNRCERCRKFNIINESIVCERCSMVIS